MIPHLQSLGAQLAARYKTFFTRGRRDRHQPAIAELAGCQALSAEGHCQYQDILDDQTELICRYRADTTLLYVNPAYCRYFGLTQQDLLNQSFHPVIYEADRAAIDQQVRLMTCENPQITIENRVVVRGEIRWTQWNNRCICDENGNITAYQSVGRDITELKAIEQRSRDSEARYRGLIETIPQLVWVAEADGINRVDFNQRWFRFTGQTFEQVAGQGWLSVVHPDDIDDLLARWDSAFANDRYEAEYRLRRQDGVYIWHLSKAEPYFDAQGQITRWYGTCTDISDRKQTEANYRQAELALQKLNATLEKRVEERTQELIAANLALKQEIAERQRIAVQMKASEAQLRRAIVAAPFPIFIHAEDGTILQMSQAVSDITGYSADELSTLEDWTKRAYGDRQVNASADISRLFEHNSPVSEGESEIKTQPGGTRTWLFSSAPLGRLSDGKRLVISMAADVTQQKQTEATLATRLRQQAVVTQLSQMALSGLNLHTLFEQSTQLLADSLNVEFCQVLELQPDGRSLVLRAGIGWPPEIMGQTVLGADDTTSQARYTLQTQQPVIVEDMATETRFQCAALLLEHHIISGMSTLIQGHGDRPFGILSTHSTRYRSFTQDDVNFLQAVANLLAAALNRKHTETALNDLNQTLEERIRDRTQALEEVNAELEAFSYSVAHDLRAPLRSIQGFAHVLQEDYGQTLDPLGQEYIARMASSAEYLDELIRDLLTYSQLGRAEITLRHIEIEPVLAEALGDLQSRIEATQAKITIASNLPKVYAQRRILRQIFANLISNALKFTAPGCVPQIQIWAEPRRSPPDAPDDHPCWLRIWIQDNGIGIAPRHQERIFKPFERLHGVEAYPGTGIGLSIVQRGIQRMGGRLGVESKEDQGSRFWIDLKG